MKQLREEIDRLASALEEAQPTETAPLSPRPATRGELDFEALDGKTPF